MLTQEKATQVLRDLKASADSALRIEFSKHTNSGRREAIKLHRKSKAIALAIEALETRPKIDRIEARINRLMNALDLLPPKGKQTNLILQEIHALHAQIDALEKSC